MSFDVLAPHYRWMEAVLAGGTLQRVRTAWLGRVGQPERVLLAGEGNGRFLRAALRAFPGATFHCVDASAAMLRRARNGLSDADASRVVFEIAALPAWKPDGAFDLVVTHFFLDCFPPADLARIMELLAAVAAPRARWLVADFAIPARGLARVRATVIHALMYRFFRVAARLPASELTPPEPILTELGFVREAVLEEEWGLLRSSLWRRGGGLVRGDAPTCRPFRTRRVPPATGRGG